MPLRSLCPIFRWEMGKSTDIIRAFLLCTLVQTCLAFPVFAEEKDTAAQELAPTYRIESILIEGNSHTDVDVVKNLINFKPGDIFIENIAEESRFRLLTSGYFRNVRVQLRKGTERGKVVVVFTVEERGTLMVDEVHIGFSNVNYFWAGGAVTEMNLAGKGLQLTGGAVGGQDMMAFKLRCLNPNVAGSEWKIGGGLMYNNAREATTDSDTGDMITLLWYWRAGGDVALSLIGPGIDASHNYERAHMDGLNATTNWVMAYLLQE